MLSPCSAFTALPDGKAFRIHKRGMAKHPPKKIEIRRLELDYQHFANTTELIQGRDVACQKYFIISFTLKIVSVKHTVQQN